MDLVLTILILVAVQLVSFLVLRGQIRQELNATTLLKDVQDEVDGMVRELNLSAERNIGLLEARIEELEGLLEQSDQKLLLLARELDRKDRSAELYNRLKPAPVPEEVPAPLPEQVRPSAPAPAAASPAPAAPQTLKERVLALRDQGLGPAEIAVATAATRGEVELILSLNPRG